MVIQRREMNKVGQDVTAKSISLCRATLGVLEVRNISLAGVQGGLTRIPIGRLRSGAATLSLTSPRLGWHPIHSLLDGTCTTDLPSCEPRTWLRAPTAEVDRFTSSPISFRPPFHSFTSRVLSTNCSALARRRCSRCYLCSNSSIVCCPKPE